MERFWRKSNVGISFCKSKKKTRLQIDKDLLIEARGDVQKLIKTKKKHFFGEQLRENVGKPKELWRTLKSLGLDEKGKPPADVNVILKKADGALSSSPEDTANLFKSFYANLADGLLKVLPKPKHLFGATSVAKF